MCKPHDAPCSFICKDASEKESGPARLGMLIADRGPGMVRWRNRFALFSSWLAQTWWIPRRCCGRGWAPQAQGQADFMQRLDEAMTG
jgi:hypothetical protein